MFTVRRDSTLLKAYIFFAVGISFCSFIIGNGRWYGGVLICLPLIIWQLDRRALLVFSDNGIKVKGHEFRYWEEVETLEFTHKKFNGSGWYQVTITYFGTEKNSQVVFERTDKLVTDVVKACRPYLVDYPQIVLILDNKVESLVKQNQG